MAMMASSRAIMPRSPWLASAGWTKKAGVPVEASVAASFEPIWPLLPTPVPQLCGIFTFNRETFATFTTRYVELAKRHGLSPAQFALAFVNSRPFVTSNLIGATSLDQLKENIASVDVKLSQDVLDEIDALHQLQPNPAP